MPFSASDAKRHTHRANTSRRRRVWASVANEVLDRTGDDAQAVRQANAAIDQLADESVRHQARRVQARRHALGARLI